MPLRRHDNDDDKDDNEGENRSVNSEESGSADDSRSKLGKRNDRHSKSTRISSRNKYGNNKKSNKQHRRNSNRSKSRSNSSSRSNSPKRSRRSTNRDNMRRGHEWNNSVDDSRNRNYGNGVDGSPPWRVSNRARSLSDSDVTMSDVHSGKMNADNTLSAITQKLFTPTKSGNDPARRIHGSGRSTPITPRSFRVEVDYDTAKRVKKSKEQYTASGPPKLRRT